MVTDFGLIYRIQKFIGVSLIRAFEGMITLVEGRKVYFDTNDFPFTKEMEAHWQEIRNEYLRLAGKETIPNIQDWFKEIGLVTQGDNWKSYALILYSYNFLEHQRKCPRSTELIKQIPGVSAAMFSILAPGKRILPHRGPYKGVLRYHLGLVIPTEYKKCTMRVDGIERHWQNGGSMVFDDTFQHEAINASDQTRVVLFVDFVRPLPFPLNKINQAIFSLITKSPFIQGVLKESEKMETLSFEKEKITF